MFYWLYQLKAVYIFERHNISEIGFYNDLHDVIAAFSFPHTSKYKLSIMQKHIWSNLILSFAESRINTFNCKKAFLNPKTKLRKLNLLF